MASAYPDGVRKGQADRRSALHRHANPFSVLVLGAVLLTAMLGILGGGRSPVVRSDGAQASLSVKMPHTLRSGLFFETDVTVEAKADVADAVIAIPPSLWQDETINSQVPAPESEEFKDGAFRFHYGPLRPGERLQVKIDGQINPPLTIGTRGHVALLDGEREIARVPLSIRVLP